MDGGVAPTGAESESLAFDALLAALTHRLLRTSRDGIDEALRDVAAWLEVDVLGLFERADDDHCRPRLLLGPGTATVLSESAFSFQANDGAGFFVSGIDELPPEATAERALLAQLGVVSAAMLPLGSLAFVVFASTHEHVPWKDPVVLRLRLLASIIAQALARNRAEAQLRESEGRAQRSEARLRLNTQALEVAANAISITNRHGHIVWCNAALSRLTGFPSEEIVGRAHSLFDSGCHGPDFWSVFWNTITAGRVWRGEVVNRRRDGSTFTQEMTVTPVQDDTGAQSHFIAVAQDVTIRRQMEKELRREVALSSSVESLSQALLRARTVRETLSLAIAEARRITSSPLGFAAAVRVETGELQLPAHMEAAFETETGTSIPRLDAPGGIWQRISSTRRPLFSNDVRTDPRLADLPDGSISLERYLGVPALHGDALAGVLAVANASRDYDRSDLRALERIAAALALGLERARAEEAQAAGEAAVRALLDASPEVELLLDGKARILDANRRALDEIGLPRERLLGLDFLRLFPDRAVSQRRQRLREVLETARSSNFEETERARVFDVTIVPIADPEGTVGRVALHARDVSRSRHLESELRRMATEWRQTSDALPLAILVVDPFDRILRLNHTALGLLGQGTFNEVIGMPLSHLTTDEPWAAIAQAVAVVRAGERSDPRQVSGARSHRTWLVGASPLSWVATEGQWSLAFATDVTAIEDLSERLRRTEKMAEMGALMGGVAHEVRNPLFAISANVDVLDRGARCPPRSSPTSSMPFERVSRAWVR